MLKVAVPQISGGSKSDSGGVVGPMVSAQVLLRKEKYYCAGRDKD